MTTERSFPNDLQSISQARRFALDSLDGFSPEVYERVALMVSELATNAVRHAGSAFTVLVDPDTHEIRISVTDSGDGHPSLRSPQLTDYSGRGLLIVRSLSDDWGVTEMTARTGKTVWFVITLDSQGGAASASRFGVPDRRETVAGPGKQPAQRTPARKPPESRRDRPPSARRSSCSARKRSVVL